MNKGTPTARFVQHMLLLFVLALALPLAVFSQQARPQAVTPLEPRSTDSATAAFGILGPETESFFARIPSAPKSAGEYLHLHLIAWSTTNAVWSNALVRLAVVGDDFTIRTLQSVKKPGASPQVVQSVDLTIKRINDRLIQEGPNPSAAILFSRLERAALADIICHPLETSLVPWALASVRPQLHRPEIKSALEKLAAQQIPPTQQLTMDIAYRARLARYANQLLEGRK